MSQSYVQWYRVRYPNAADQVPGFLEWVSKIETLVLGETGLYLTELPDEDFMFHFSIYTSPAEMANMILDNNGMS